MLFLGVRTGSVSGGMYVPFSPAVVLLGSSSPVPFVIGRNETLRSLMAVPPSAAQFGWHVQFPDWLCEVLCVARLKCADPDFSAGV